MEKMLFCGSFQYFIFFTFHHDVWLSSALQQLQVGVEFEASTRMQDTSVSFGYQLDVPKANLLFKGRVCTLRIFQERLDTGLWWKLYKFIEYLAVWYTLG